jgi:CBS domain-containing protein
MAETMKSETGYKLSQAAPTMPIQTKEEVKPETYGVEQPISAPTIPSVYNKKLNKLFRGRLVVLPGNCTVEEALRRMTRYNISAVPVVKSKQDPTILGFAGMLDFLAYLGKLLSTEGTEELNLDEENLKSKTETFRKTSLSQIVDQSGRDPFHVMNGDESLSDAVQYYLKGVHRIAITDDIGDIIGVISQWTVANYLATVPTGDKDWIPVLREPLCNVKFTRNVAYVNGRCSTLQSFFRMHKDRVSSLAVVDDEGKLIGNLSVSDLKGYQLYLSNFTDLLQPVSQFLSLIRLKQGRQDNFAVAFNPETHVKDVVEKLNEHIVHRAYVIDDNRKPIGVFSLTDLMQQLIVDTHTIATYAKITALPESERNPICQKPGPMPPATD